MVLVVESRVDRVLERKSCTSRTFCQDPNGQAARRLGFLGLDDLFLLLSSAWGFSFRAQGPQLRTEASGGRGHMERGHFTQLLRPLRASGLWDGYAPTLSRAKATSKGSHAVHSRILGPSSRGHASFNVGLLSNNWLRPESRSLAVHARHFRKSLRIRNEPRLRRGSTTRPRWAAKGSQSSLRLRLFRAPGWWTPRQVSARGTLAPGGTEHGDMRLHAHETRGLLFAELRVFTAVNRIEKPPLEVEAANMDRGRPSII